MDADELLAVQAMRLPVDDAANSEHCAPTPQYVSTMYVPVYTQIYRIGGYPLPRASETSRACCPRRATRFPFPTSGGPMAEHCGAKTRAGGICQQPAKPNGRCRYHGGLSTGPKTPNSAKNALKHGFYSDALTPDEQELWQRVEVGALDDEIRLMRVKLFRLVKLSGSEDVTELVDSALEVAQKHDAHPKRGALDKTEIRVKVARYGELIVQALDTIRKLELARKELVREGGGKTPGDDVPIGKIIVEVVGAKPAHDHDGAAGAVLPATR